MAIKRQIVYSRLNYYKVKITENKGTEWDEIVRETVRKIDKKALKKSNSYSYKFFLIVVLLILRILMIYFLKNLIKNWYNISGISPEYPRMYFRRNLQEPWSANIRNTQES